MTRQLKRRLALGLVLLGCGPALLWLANWRITAAAKGRLYASATEVPAMHAALVLGTSPLASSGLPNRFFLPRIQAAAELFHQGRVNTIIVSGDNSRPDYDEPTAMQQALVKMQVPAERIVRDFAGLRTLDSVVRAKEIFGQSRIVIVSQSFHNERAIYLARAHGLDAVGFNARDVPVSESMKTRLREVLARLAAVLDVHAFKTKPVHLGDPITLP
jgi:SanA protein